MFYSMIHVQMPRNIVSQVHNATSLCVPKAKWYFAIYESFESLKIQRHYTKLKCNFLSSVYMANLEI
jgi:hypothetical protein